MESSDLISYRWVFKAWKDSTYILMVVLCLIKVGLMTLFNSSITIKAVIAELTTFYILKALATYWIMNKKYQGWKLWKLEYVELLSVINYCSIRILVAYICLESSLRILYLCTEGVIILFAEQAALIYIIAYYIYSMKRYGPDCRIFNIMENQEGIIIKLPQNADIYIYKDYYSGGKHYGIVCNKITTRNSNLKLGIKNNNL